MRVRRGRRRGRLAGGIVLLACATVLLAGTLGLSLAMLGQTRELSSKVELTEDIVDGNVRTVSQAQRELLRLKALLVQEDPDLNQVRLQRDLVTQRAQESSLAHQLKTLGSEDLLEQASAYQREWSQLAPLVVPAIESPVAERTSVLQRIDALELGYNQLVSDGENNRKREAGTANRATIELLGRAQQLLGGLLVTFVLVVVMMSVGGWTWSRFHRQREAASRELEALNRDLERYAHVVRSTDNMVVVTDPDGCTEWVNAAFERTTGWSLDEVRGRTPGDVLQGPGTDEETVLRMRAALAEGSSFSEEVLNYRRDGSAYWVAVEANPLHDERGRVTGFVAVETDITERRASQELLQRAKETAEETAEAKSSFLASMSHEIRTPLNAVLGLTDLLLMTELDDQQRDYVRTAHSSGKLLLDLLNDVLTFSSLEADQATPEERPFRLRTVLRDTGRMFDQEARRKGLGLSTSIDPDLPDRVVGDETRLRQILVNLVGNAIKFTEHGQVELVARSTEDGRTLIEVRDTGIGIDSERLPQLFQPFTQGDVSTTRKYGGTGLGLAICRLLADSMGGAVTSTSTPGEGSVFAVLLDLPEAPTQAPVAPVGGLDLTPLSLRVLVAEDDRVNQTVASHMLRRLGIEPVLVEDGAQAVAAATGGDFDIVLMDVHMPTMDGVEATAEIRRRMGDHAPRITAVTANALDGDRERLLEAGMDDYVSKPMQLADLRACLERALAALDSAAAEVGPVRPTSPV